MTVATSGMIDHFNASVNDDLLRHLIRLTFQCYREAHTMCEEYFDVERTHDALPINRRGLIEQAMANLPGRFPVVSASSELNKAHNSFHAKMMIGRVVLTESSVQSPDTIVRGAIFRSDYVDEYQLALDFMNQAPPPPDGLLYAIMIHGTDSRQPIWPDFVHIVFPGRDCQCYLERINLLERFKDLVEELKGRETVIETPLPILRPNIRRGESELKG